MDNAPTHSNKLISIIAVVVIYIYIFAPPFKLFPFGLDKICLLWALLYVTINNKWNEIKYYFGYDMFILGCICAYSIFLCIIHGRNAYFLGYDIILFIEVLIVPYAIYSYFYIKKHIEIDKISIYAAVVAGLISIWLFINPELSTILKQTYLRYPELALKNFEWRGFGISDGLLYAYPLVEGLACALIILGILKKNIIYNIIAIIILCLAVIPNARSGFIPIILSLCILFFSNCSKLVKYFILSIIIVTCLNSLFDISSLLSPNETKVFEWAFTSVDIIFDLFNGEKTENAEALFDTMVIWPSSLDEWLVGTGNSLYGKSIGSDIGYILRLNYGGIMYLLLWVIVIARIFFKLYSKDHSLSILVVGTILYANLKGDLFLTNPICRYIFFIYATVILSDRLFRINEYHQKFNNDFKLAHK